MYPDEEATPKRTFLEDPGSHEKDSRADFRVSRVFCSETATIVGGSSTTMRRIAKEPFRHHSYMMKIRQMLSEDARMRRMARCHLLISSLKNEAAGEIRFFFDRKFSTADTEIIRRNDPWLARDPEDVTL